MKKDEDYLLAAKGILHNMREETMEPDLRIALATTAIACSLIALVERIDSMPISYQDRIAVDVRGSIDTFKGGMV